MVPIGAVATPPTYVATRLVLPREAGGSASAWIVPLDPTHVSAFETEWVPELRAMEQYDVGWDWRGELNRSANVPEFELYRRYGMTECGRDPEVCGDDGRPELYFEFSVDAAKRFIALRERAMHLLRASGTSAPSRSK